MAKDVKENASGSGELIGCFDCNQLCCRTTVIEVDPPRSLRDYSDILFYLYHFDTELVIARNGRSREWFVEFMSPCMHLVDGRCSIYEKRPLVCREYDMEECEYNNQERFLYIKTPEEFYAFLKTDGRTKILAKLKKTHMPPEGSALRNRPRTAKGKRTRIKRPLR